MSRTYLLLFSALVLGLASCSKYEDGGLMKEAEQNLQRQWTVSDYHNNDPATSQDFPFTNYTEEFMNDGVFTRTFTDDRGISVTEIGSWELDPQKTGVYMIPQDGLSMAGMGIYGANYYRKILSLTSDEFKYSFVNDSIIHTFTLSAN